MNAVQRAFKAWMRWPTWAQIGSLIGLIVVLLIISGAVNSDASTSTAPAQVESTATEQAAQVLAEPTETPRPSTATAAVVQVTATRTATATATPNPNDPARVREYRAAVSTFGTTMGNHLQRFSDLLINNQPQNTTWKANMRRSLQDMNGTLATVDRMTPPCLNAAHGHLVAAQEYFGRMTRLMGQAMDRMDVSDYAAANPLIMQSNAALNEGASATQRATGALSASSCPS